MKVLIPRIVAHLDKHPELAENVKFQGLFSYRPDSIPAEKKTKRSSDKVAGDELEAKVAAGKPTGYVQGVYIRKVRDVHYPRRGVGGCISGPGQGHLYQETTACYFDVMIMIITSPSHRAVSSGKSICKPAEFAWFLFEIEFSSHSFYFACPGMVSDHNGIACC